MMLLSGAALATVKKRVVTSYLGDSNLGLQIVEWFAQNVTILYLFNTCATLIEF